MDPRTIERVRQEIQIMAGEIGATDLTSRRVEAGRVTVGGREYLGVIVRDLAVNPQKFNGVKSLNGLILLPENYPRVPPLGIYLDRPYDAESHHFVRRGYHGAPTLNAQGWYWFCTAIGGFEPSTRQGAWVPAPEPQNGHNLATVLAALRVAMGQ